MEKQKFDHIKNPTDTDDDTPTVNTRSRYLRGVTGTMLNMPRAVMAASVVSMLASAMPKDARPPALQSNIAMAQVIEEFTSMFAMAFAGNIKSGLITKDEIIETAKIIKTDISDADLSALSGVIDAMLEMWDFEPEEADAVIAAAKGTPNA